MIYTFSDIRTLLFVFFMASEIIRKEPQSFSHSSKSIASRDEKIKIQTQFRRKISIFSWTRRNCSRSYLGKVFIFGFSQNARKIIFKTKKKYYFFCLEESEKLCKVSKLKNEAADECESRLCAACIEKKKFFIQQINFRETWSDIWIIFVALLFPVKSSRQLLSS